MQAGVPGLKQIVGFSDQSERGFWKRLEAAKAHPVPPIHSDGKTVWELYKLDNGKYIAPAPLEEQIALSPYIAQAVIHGSNRPYNVALLVPDLAALRDWARAHQVPVDDVARLFVDERVKRLIAEEIERHSAGWKSYEHIRNFALVSEEFSTTNDMLTPTLKVKRRNVVQRYGDRIDALYAAS